MKKVLVILLLVVLLASFCACSYVPSNRFLSKAKVNSLVKKYGTPQAEVTFSYETKDGGEDKNIEVRVTYDLLLSQTPLAVIRFIQLANEGFYNDTVIDKYNSSYKYALMGRYAYKDSDLQEEKQYYVNKSDVTFKGEFSSNKYREPKDGFAQFSTFALAMYHDEYTIEQTNFDTADGTLILALANETLNSNNYAVFAKMNTFEYKTGDGEFIKLSKPASSVLKHIASTSTTKATVYYDKSEDSSTRVDIMSPRVTISVRILGNYDWSKLPKIGR